MKPCCESVERYYEDKITALEAEITRLRAALKEHAAPRSQWIIDEQNRRLFVCPCVGEDARDLLRFIADAYKAITIVSDEVAGTNAPFPSWELMDDLLLGAVVHNPGAAAEMLVNILTFTGVLEHGGNWRYSWTHGAHDKYVDELLTEGDQ